MLNGTHRVCHVHLPEVNLWAAFGILCVLDEFACGVAESCLDGRSCDHDSLLSQEREIPSGS